MKAYQSRIFWLQVTEKFHPQAFTLADPSAYDALPSHSGPNSSCPKCHPFSYLSLKPRAGIYLSNTHFGLGTCRCAGTLPSYFILSVSQELLMGRIWIAFPSVPSARHGDRHLAGTHKYMLNEWINNWINEVTDKYINAIPSAWTTTRHIHHNDSPFYWVMYLLPC